MLDLFRAFHRESFAVKEALRLDTRVFRCILVNAATSGSCRTVFFGAVAPITNFKASFQASLPNSKVSKVLR